MTADDSHAAVPFTNCHVHTFTHAHKPDRFVKPRFNWLLRIGPLRRALLRIIHWVDPKRDTSVGRYAEILETSYGKDQAAVFAQLEGFYPVGRYAEFTRASRPPRKACEGTHRSLEASGARRRFPLL